MRARWVRHAPVTLALLLFVAGPAPGWASGPNNDEAAFVGAAPARLPAASIRPDGASVDPRVWRGIARGRPVEVLLVLDGASTLVRASATGETDSRAFLRSVVPAYRELKDAVHARLPRLEILTDYRTLPILHVLVRSRDVLERAAADPAVVGIGAQGEERAFLSESLPLIGQPAAAAAGHTGAGTAVAVLDSGVDHTRSAFGDCSGGPGTGSCKVVVSRDFASPDGELDDAILHGTNVAGIVVGVAPDTRILALDVFDGDGARVSDVIDAIDFTIANQSSFNVRAMNLSLGNLSFNTSPCSESGNPYVAAFANARAAGILPVIAAGNSRFLDGSSKAGIARPACTPGAISVGAVYDSNVGSVTVGSGNDQCTDSPTAADKITCFSQTASFLSVLAPGAFATAAGVTQLGTSQATPHVAGAVAALADASPTATPSAIESAIATSGPLINDSLVNTSFHRLDIPAAVAALENQPSPPPPPPPGSCTIEGDGQDDFLQGTAGDDVICGNGGNDILVPGGGTDVVIGGSGFDFVSFQNASTGARVDIGAGVATAGSNAVTLEEVEGAFGSQFGDELVGDGAQNELLGLGGSDVIDGAGGLDFARFDFATRAIRASLSAGSARGEGSDRLIRVEGLVGGGGSDALEGSGATNFLFGFGGNDVLSGLGRADTLSGGAGVDALFGGRGDDDLFGGAGADTCDQQGGSGTVSSC